METVSLTKKHFTMLIGLIIAVALIAGWFVGVFLFEGRNVENSLRDRREKDWLNIMTSEYLPLSTIDGWMQDSATRFGSDVSEYRWPEKADGSVLYVNKRHHFTVTLPQKIRMTTEVVDNPGVPVLVYEDTANDTYFMEGAALFDQSRIVASANMSMLPTFVQPTPAEMVAGGMRLTTMTDVSETNLSKSLEKAFPGCAVSSQVLEKTSFDGTVDIIPTYTDSSSDKSCGLLNQPIIKYSPTKQLLLITGMTAGCRFRIPGELASNIVQKCVDDDIFSSIHFTD